MDEEMIFESFDSLWFSSNILSKSSLSLHRPKIQPLSSDPVESPKILVSPIEQQIPQPKGSEISSRKKSGSSSQQSRKRSNKICKEEIKEAKELTCLVSTLLKHQYNYCHSCGVDDLAMKEHIKSWAHAVACTVK